MSFEKFAADYLARGLLKKQKIDFPAVAKLVSRAYKDIKTARANMAIDEGVAFSVAYMAMIHAARALMLANGYRPSDGAQHKTAIEFVGKLLGANYRDMAEEFDRMRRKRNIFTYEVGAPISFTEADNAITSAAGLVELIRSTIQKGNPQQEFEWNTNPD
ncbi:MAG: HEPN domain-containing protein [Candidatus Saganbacteria bacterium]|nr:HEPN domain-containing protein [Candidatus Saganbacteria bacterium]